MSTPKLPLYMQHIMTWAEADDATIVYALIRTPPASFVWWVIRERPQALELYCWLCKQEAAMLKARAEAKKRDACPNQEWRP